jgi:hypothetical protein
MFAYLYAFPTKYRLDTFQRGARTGEIVLAFAFIALITIGAFY